MSHKIFTLQEIDVSKFKFSEAKALNVGKSVYMNLEGKPLYFQTPICSVPFGVTAWDETAPRYIMNVNLSDQMLQKIEEIESRVIDEALKESGKWFKKAINNREVVSEFFTSSIRKDPKGVYGPTMKLNLPTRDNNIACEGYRKILSTGEVLPLEITKDSIGKRCNIAAIVQCNTVWIAGGNKFGCTFKVVQLMRIDETPESTGGPNKITGYAFIEDSDNE